MNGAEITAILVATFGLVGTGLTLYQNHKLGVIHYLVNSKMTEALDAINKRDDTIRDLKQYITEHPTFVNRDVPPSMKEEI